MRSSLNLSAQSKPVANFACLICQTFPMKNAKNQVKITANAECNLEYIERFLLADVAPQAFDVLLDELNATILANLERCPELGGCL